MNATPEQQAWSTASWRSVADRIRRWSAEESIDYSPLLALLDSIRTAERQRELSLGTSLRAVVIAPSDLVVAADQLGIDSPWIAAIQRPNGFTFKYAPRGGRGHSYERESTFDQAAEVLESFLIRLKLQRPG